MASIQTRSRNGCFSCRRRKKKCDEIRPLCSGCERNQLDCRWPALISTDNNFSPPRCRERLPRKDSLTSCTSPNRSVACRPCSTCAHARPSCSGGSTIDRAVHLPSSSHLDRDTGRPRPIVESFNASENLLSQDLPLSHPVHDQVSASSVLSSPSSPSTPTTSSSSSSPASPCEPVPPGSSPDSLSPSLDHNDEPSTDLAPLTGAGEEYTDVSREPQAPLVPRTLATLQMEPRFQELLAHYLSRTANSMGNGSGEVNPFIACLIPLAFSEPLLLHLIIAQSATHRRSLKGQEGLDDATPDYYIKSLSNFRSCIGNFVRNKGERQLVLAVGSLTLSLTEVARGDTSGSTFSHLAAAKSLWPGLVTRGDETLPKDLEEFLVEYYIHMTATSAIALGSEEYEKISLEPDLEHQGWRLVSEKYIGNLCGCWIELMLCITKIAHIGPQMRSAIKEGRALGVDDLMIYGLMQAQISNYRPDPSCKPDTYLAALVFQQSALLYLWTILGDPQVPGDRLSTHCQLIDNAIQEALSLLDQIPPASRINTSLLWPIIVIGTCIADLTLQEKLRSRLQSAFSVLGLGNIRETLSLLECIWRRPRDDTSPWTLWKVMRDQQLGMSFA